MTNNLLADELDKIADLDVGLAENGRAIVKEAARRLRTEAEPENLCGVTFPHMPHDRCDGKPDAKPFGKI